MNTGEVFALEEELVTLHIPYNSAVLVLDLPEIRGGDEALLVFIEVTRVGKWQCRLGSLKYF